MTAGFNTPIVLTWKTHLKKKKKQQLLWIGGQDPNATQLGE